jgi:hypothetical protein
MRFIGIDLPMLNQNKSAVRLLLLLLLLQVCRVLTSSAPLPTTPPSTASTPPCWHWLLAWLQHHLSW